MNRLLAWLRILSDPRFRRLMDNAQQTREEIAYRILTTTDRDIRTDNALAKKQ